MGGSRQNPPAKGGGCKQACELQSSNQGGGRGGSLGVSSSGPSEPAPGDTSGELPRVRLGSGDRPSTPREVPGEE